MPLFSVTAGIMKLFFPVQTLHKPRQGLQGHLLLGNIWWFTSSPVMAAVWPAGILRDVEVK